MNIISFFWKNGCWRDRRVKSSNLSISICWSDQKEEAYAETLEETEAYHTYLENRILNKNELNIQIRISRHPRPYKRLYGRNKLVNAKAFINKPRTKASNAMGVRGTAATRRGESFWLSYKERRVDALALRADERRDKLRKASGRSKYPLIRRYLNGETRLSKPQSLHGESIAMQGEPGELKHLSSRRKRKKHRFPK